MSAELKKKKKKNEKKKASSKKKNTSQPRCKAKKKVCLSALQKRDILNDLITKFDSLEQQLLFYEQQIQKKLQKFRKMKREVDKWDKKKSTGMIPVLLVPNIKLKASGPLRYLTSKKLVVWWEQRNNVYHCRGEDFLSFSIPKNLWPLIQTKEFFISINNEKQLLTGTVCVFEHPLRKGKTGLLLHCCLFWKDYQLSNKVVQILFSFERDYFHLTHKPLPIAVTEKGFSMHRKDCFTAFDPFTLKHCVYDSEKRDWVSFHEKKFTSSPHAACWYEKEEKKISVSLPPDFFGFQMGDDGRFATSQRPSSLALVANYLFLFPPFYFGNKSLVEVWNLETQKRISSTPLPQLLLDPFLYVDRWERQCYLLDGADRDMFLKIAPDGTMDNNPTFLSSVRGKNKTLLFAIGKYAYYFLSILPSYETSIVAYDKKTLLPIRHFHLDHSNWSGTKSPPRFHSPRFFFVDDDFPDSKKECQIRFYLLAVPVDRLQEEFFQVDVYCFPSYP